MNHIIKSRVLMEANYIIETKKTIRELATIYKLSKSTIHKDLHERLKEIDETLYNQVNEIMKYHTEIKHIRGGNATKIKYLNK